LKAGLYEGLDEISALWHREHRFEPNMQPEKREKLYSGWLDAVERVR
jgi:glycerol kinase